MTALGMTSEQAQDLLWQMVFVRRYEERCAQLYGEQKIRGFLHLYVGEEAVAVGAIRALQSEDPIVATYREHAHALVRGVPAETIMAEMFGKVSGCAKGRGGSMHIFDLERAFYGGYAIVGGGLPIALGLALADKMQGRRRAIACFFGDGATDEGEFHETLNLAALWELPVLFLCENNLYAMGTALPRHAANVELAEKATAYRIQAEAVDGMDVLAVHRAVGYAAEVVRDAGQPRFLELHTYRYRAHSMYDPERYRSKEEVARWKERDPIPRLAARLEEAGITADMDAIEREVADAVERAVRFAEEAPLESVEDLERHVLAREVP